MRRGSTAEHRRGESPGGNDKARERHLPRQPDSRILPTMSDTQSRRCLAILGLVLGLLLTTSSAFAQSSRAGRASVVTFDGHVAEWPVDVVAVADQDYLYLRFMFPGERISMQAGEHTTSIWLDLDSNPETGLRGVSPAEARNFGFDLEIQFSPRNSERSSPDRGCVVYVLSSDQSFRKIGHAEIGVAALPTHAAENFEVRIPRYLPDVAGLPMEGFRSTGTTSGMVVELNNQGRLLRSGQPFTAAMPASRGAPPTFSATIPPKVRPSVRVLSFNVQRSAPIANPEPFARLIRAADPDVILLQEWDEGNAADLEAWFTRNVSNTTPWFTLRGAGQGVAIVSRLPMRPLDPLELTGTSGPVRALSAIVRLGTTEIAVTSVHLKCCGTFGSPEDQTRLDEAGLINAVLAAGYAARPPAVRVIGGDFNLVGSTDPMSSLRHALDRDGSDLGIALPLALGTPAALTWRDAASPFSPSRLDYFLYSDASASILNAFVLDTAILSDNSLNAAGLQRGDSAASDHLPIIVDIRAR